MFISKSSQNHTPGAGVPSEIEQLRTLLYTDDLTGVYNRRFFRHCIAEQKAHSDQTGVAFSLLRIDVDHFKKINDRNGHAAGDSILVNIAHLLRKEFQDLGWVFRYAGDEFVGLLRIGKDELIQDFCAGILRKVSDLNPAGVSASISIGYAIYPNSTRSIGDLLEIAGRALSYSKRAGASQFHPSLQTTRIEEHGMAVSFPSPILIGRQREWNRLQQHLFACRKGEGKILWITGGPGIGKSRLLRNFLRCQRTTDYHILLSECTKTTTAVPYAPIREALKRGFEAKDPATVNVFKELDEARRRTLVQLIPQFDRFGKPSRNAAPSFGSEFLAESISLLLHGLSRQLPVVLVIEDLNWCDESTLNLIQMLQKDLETTRILIIATNNTVPPRFLQHDEETSVDVMELKPLSIQEIGFLLEEIFRKTKISSGLQKWIYSNSQGIPRQVEQLLKLLITEGSIEIGPHEVKMRS